MDPRVKFVFSKTYETFYKTNYVFITFIGLNRTRKMIEHLIEQIHVSMEEDFSNSSTKFSIYKIGCKRFISLIYRINVTWNIRNFKMISFSELILEETSQLKGSIYTYFDKY